MSTTVITPTIQERSHTLLPECIESVAMQNIKPDNHIIVVDSNKRGPSSARNKGIKAADTDWVSFLDDDDVMYENHIEEHSKYFDESIDVIYSWGMISFPEGSTKEFKGRFDRARIIEGHNTMPVTTSIRRELLLDVGGFDTNARFEDLDLWQRLIKVDAKFFVIREFTWEYRIQSESRNSKE